MKKKFIKNLFFLFLNLNKRKHVKHFCVNYEKRTLIPLENNRTSVCKRRGSNNRNEESCKRSISSDGTKRTIMNIKRNKFLRKQNKEDEDLIYGLNSAYAVLTKNERIVKDVMVTENLNLKRKVHRKTYEHIFHILAKRNIEIKKVPKKEMDKIASGFMHNDIILKTQPRHMKSLSDFFTNIKNFSKNNTYICLHNVYDNMNIGNICRSIYFFGGRAIFLKKTKKGNRRNTRVKIDAPILHASVGASEFIEFFHVHNMVKFVNEMKHREFTIYSTSCPNNDLCNNKFMDLETIPVRKNEKRLIILGNESRGVSEEILKNSDVVIYINNDKTTEKSTNLENADMPLDSLNVGNVCSILLHYFS